MKELEEMEKALIETYELNASLRKQVETLEANLKHLNINYKTALKVNDDFLFSFSKSSLTFKAVL